MGDDEGGRQGGQVHVPGLSSGSDAEHHDDDHARPKEAAEAAQCAGRRDARRRAATEAAAVVAQMAAKHAILQHGNRWKRQNRELVLWSVSKALEADPDFDFYGGDILVHYLFLVDAVYEVCPVPDLRLEITTMQTQLAEAKQDMLTLASDQERVDCIFRCMCIVQPKLAEYIPVDYMNKLSFVVDMIERDRDMVDEVDADSNGHILSTATISELGTNNSISSDSSSNSSDSSSSNSEKARNTPELLGAESHLDRSMKDAQNKKFIGPFVLAHTMPYDALRASSSLSMAVVCVRSNPRG